LIFLNYIICFWNELSVLFASGILCGNWWHMWILFNRFTSDYIVNLLFLSKNMSYLICRQNFDEIKCKGWSDAIACHFFTDNAILCSMMNMVSWLKLVMQDLLLILWRTLKQRWKVNPRVKGVFYTAKPHKMDKWHGLVEEFVPTCSIQRSI
jgi:hypothetical protein